MLYKSNENLDNKKCLGCLETGHFKLIPEKYISWIVEGVPMVNEELEEEFIKKVIKASPNFDQAAWDRRIHWEEYDDNLNNKIKQEQANQPKCPTCGSTDIKKITLTKKVVKTAAFGMLGAMDDAGKTYKCGNCGSKF